MGHLKSPICLPVLWNTESATELKQLGIDCEEPPEIKKITFYTIDHIFASTYGKDKKPCTLIVSGGSEYCVEDSVGVINSAILDKL